MFLFQTNTINEVFDNETEALEGANEPALNELIEDGKTVLVIDDDDEKEFLDHIIEVVESESAYNIILKNE